MRVISMMFYALSLASCTFAAETTSDGTSSQPTTQDTPQMPPVEEETPEESKVPSADDCPYQREGAGYEEYRTAAIIYKSQKNFAEAEGCFKAALRTTFSTFAALSELNFQRNDLAGALAYAEVLVNMDRTGDASMIYAIRLMQVNEHEKALPLLEQLAKSNPENAGIWHKLGIATLRTIGTKEAVPLIARAAELNPDVFGDELESVKSLLSEQENASDNNDTELKVSEEPQEL